MARDHREEFTDFAAARQRSLLRAAYLMVGEEALAHDLVQEALVKTYVAWPRLRRVESAEAYARRAITTTAIGWFRRRSWSAEQPMGAPPDRPGAGHADQVTREEWIWQALRQLPARQRAAVVLRYVEDLTEAQTAEAMDCAVGTVKSQVHAALRSLRSHLGDDADDLLLTGGTR